MKRIDIGQAIAIAANAGVIVGIAFLAVEVSQNNDQLAALRLSPAGSVAGTAAR